MDQNRILRTLSALACCLAFGSPAHAAARVFVSVTGADTNDCAMVTTPCRTLDAGITQVDPGGEVIVLTTGSYGGATISKSVRINVPAGLVAFSASPIVITAGSTDSVAIRGLTLKALTPGTGTAINLSSGKFLSVENCVIDGWDKGVVALNNFDTPFVTVADTIIRNGNTHGVEAGTSFGEVHAVIHNSRFENHGSCAVVARAGGRISARETVSIGTNLGGFGFCGFDIGGRLNCQDCVATGHFFDGFIASTGGTIRVSQSMATDNLRNGFRNVGSTIESLGNNLVTGNAGDTSGTITVIAGK
jgi:hypothetical protein